MAKAKKPKASKGARKKGGGFAMKLLGFLILVVGLIFLPASTLLAAGMAPTMIAYLTDADRRKTSAVAVGSLNFCGAMPFQIKLWEGANTMAQCGQMLRNPETWAVMYGAAALGAIIYYTIPPIIGGIIALQSQARLNDLQRRQAELREAWGDEVASSVRAMAQARAAKTAHAA